MSLDLEAKINAIVAWASGVTGVTVIQSHQNAPRPELPFGRVQVLSVRNPGTAQHEQKASNPNTKVYSRWTDFTVQFSFHGDSARNLAQALVDSTDFESTITTLDADNISVGPVQTINDVPQLRENGWERMTAVDIVFHAASQTEETTGYIETVSTSATINGG